MNKTRRLAVGFSLLAALLIFLILFNVGYGSVELTAGEIIRIITAREKDTPGGLIIWSIRLPRLIAVLVLGGSLSVAGFLLQTFFRNPIAGPFVLGISSGAKMCVALFMIFYIGRGGVSGSWMMIGAAFLGAMISIGFILLISPKVRSMSVLVVCGVMVGYVCSAITDFVVTFADENNIVNLHNWSMGSFSGISWENVKVMVLLCLPVLVFAFFLSKPMGAYQLGELYAGNMGVNIKLFRFELILLSGLLAACVTAFAGPISFVGVAVPHLMKNLFGTARPRIMLPAVFLGGSVFCMFCDLLVKTLFSPTELSISTVTAIFGAPIVIWIMLNRKRQ